jgi:hypothetical protein
MKRLFAVAFGAAMVASACVVEVTYDPFGSDFAMSGEWTVDGLPASSATCGQIAQVRVVLYDAGTPFDYAQLMFPCAAGGFDTGRIFRYGNYDTEWQALDSSGRIIGRGARQVLDVGPPTELVLLTPADFTGAGTWDPFGSDWSMEGTWTVNGAPASGATCGAIADVRVILWHEGTFYSYADLTFPCSAGSFATDLIFQYGDYETQWQALDAGGAIIGEGAREDLIVNAPTTSAVLRPIDFEVVGGMGTMTVNIGWEDKPPSALVFTCPDPNAPARFDFTLTDSTGGVVSSMTNLVCNAPGIDFNNLPFGTYDLEVHGYMSSGREDWNGVGTLVHATDGNSFDFDVRYDGP